MNNNTIYITRLLDAHDVAYLREKLEQRWPGEPFTIIHGQMLSVADLHRAMTAQPGPSEYKMTATPMPIFEGPCYE